MGISVIEGREGDIHADSASFCFLYDNTTDIAFGPRFETPGEALAVVASVGGGVRYMTSKEIAGAAKYLRQARGSEWWESYDENDNLIASGESA